VFAWWGRTVYQYRYIVIGVMVALCLGGGVFGISLGSHVTQSGFYDNGSDSVHASVTADAAYGPRHVRSRHRDLQHRARRQTVETPRLSRRSSTTSLRSRKTTPMRSSGRSATSRAPIVSRTWPTGTSSTRSCRSSSRATTTTPS